MLLETRKRSLTHLRACTYWFQYAGGAFSTIGEFTLFILEKVFFFFTEWWILVWAKAIESPAEILGVFFQPQLAGIPAQFKYIQVYCILMTLAFISAFLRTIWIAGGGDRMFQEVVFGDDTLCPALANGLLQNHADCMH